LFALALGLRIPIELTGLETLPSKETDRIKALCEQGRLLGAELESGADRIFLRSVPARLRAHPIATYGDHRMAMAFAPLVFSEGELTISDPEVVRKSFPAFFREFSKICRIKT
jgi:3-phosphoshikimate 1-carboxyvinyltransferase